MLHRIITKTMLLASPFGEDVEYFHRLLLGTSWTSRLAPTLEEAERCIATDRRISVIVAEHRLPGGWLPLLSGNDRGPQAPRLIVAAHNPPDRLWAEVMNRGGQDVLAKPFDDGESWYCLESAWRSWSEARHEERLLG